MNDRIQIHPNICHGKPVIRGTRILVLTIVEAYKSGDSISQILEDYPPLTGEDFAAALDFEEKLTGPEKGSYLETMALLAIPGMRESIIAGMNEKVETMDRSIDL